MTFFGVEDKERAPACAVARCEDAVVDGKCWMSLHVFDAVDEGLQLAAAAGVTELAESLGLYLADALACDLEGLADLFEGVLGAVFEAEAHLDDALFTRCQRAEDLRGVLLQVDRDDGVGGADGHTVFDEVAEVRVFLFADGRLEGDGLLRDLEDLADLRDRDVHALGDLLRGGFAAKLLHQLTAGTDELVDGLDHVDRDADGTGLVRDGSGDGLTDPPGRVGGEFVTATVLELVDGLHEADIALLDEVEELEAAVGVLLGDGDDEAKVGLDELALGALGVHVALDHLALGALEVGDGDAGVLLDALEVGAAVLLLALVLLAQLFALAGFELRLEGLDLALERAHGVDGLVDLVEQTLLLRVGVLQLADDAVDVDVLAANQPTGLASLLGLGLGVLAGEGGELLFENVDLLLVLEDDVDAAGGSTNARGQDLFGELFLVEGDDFLDVADSALEVFAEAHDLADDDRRAGDGLHDAELAALDAFGDLNLALAGEQGHRAHLAEVHADGVVGLLERAGGEVELYVVGLFAGLGLVLVAVAAELRLTGEHIDALGVDGGEQVIEIVGGGDVTGEQVVDLSVGEIALFLPGVDELVYIVFVLVNFFSHGCAHSCERFF